MSGKIITIARQFGSGGREVAMRTAKELNIPFMTGSWLKWLQKKWAMQQ